jgi:hypothetical protein
MALPLAGTYRVRLYVTNLAGIESGVSATSDVEIIAIPSSRLHVQLVWDHPSNDQDLHLVNAGGDGRIFNGTHDCFWRQCNPACVTDPVFPCDVQAHWFTSDPVFTLGNPRLDIDDTNGLGPENINIDAPREGDYNIYVHYYGLVDPDNTPTQATVRLYLDGVLRHEFRRTLSRNDMWAVAQIQWAADNTVTVAPAVADGPGVVGTVRPIFAVTYPDGTDFGPAFP